MDSCFEQLPAIRNSDPWVSRCGKSDAYSGREKACFHVINRAVVRLTLFEKAEDYEAFERVLKLAH